MVFPASSEQDFLEKMMGKITALERDVRRLEALPWSNILDIDLTDVTVTDTVVETSFYSLTIPGDVLDVGNGIRATLMGRMKQDAAGARDITIRMKYGATTIASFTRSIANGLSTLAPWQLATFLLADGATNAQEASMMGIYRRAGDINHLTSNIGAAVEDSTGDLTLDFTIEWGAASANLEFEYRQAIVEVLPL